jgi:pimeloyl-ACP methyl ester carboxylesterase
MAGPTTKQFWQAAKQIYNDPKSKNPANVLVPPDGTTLANYRLDEDEFAAAVFTSKTDPWSIIAFKGTTPNLAFQIHANFGFMSINWEHAFGAWVPVYTSSHTGLILDQTLIQDTVLAAPFGATPGYFTKGADYVARLQQLGAGGTIYLAGHSLGGAIAEYVANQTGNTGILGTCFASPGSTVFKSGEGAIRSLVDENDMVGQFCMHHHVGRVQMIDTLGIALVNDIPFSALQNLIAQELEVPLIWSLSHGRAENYIDMAPMLNVLGAITMGLSIGVYHAIDHYGMVLSFSGSPLRTRAIVNAICNAVKALFAAVYHAGQAAIGAAESAWDWVRHQVTNGLYDMLVALKAIANGLGQLAIAIKDGIVELIWGMIRIPVLIL